MEPRKQHITLQLDAHHISLNVQADKEHLYRKAAEKINERYRYYQKLAPNRSAEQIWVYVALDMAVNLQADAHANRLQPIDEKIQELNKLILQHIK
ncbi:MAG: cell division protein ZapA [Paludibacteraceae bacterium]|nr:cell division protein ZapA [Paludibacteraceae bacterium]